MPISTMTGPLAGAVAFLLSSGAAATMSSDFYVAVASFAGETEVDCGKVCEAAGMQGNTSWAYSSEANVVEYKCSCITGEVHVACLTEGVSHIFSKCCKVGEGCEPGTQPSESEAAGEKNLKEHPRTKKLLESEAEKVRLNATNVTKDGVHCPPCASSSQQLTTAEIAEAVSLHNKFRKMVDVPYLKWNCELMCQAQKQADKCVFEHSDSYNSPIPAGENLASGSDINLAAWMWFSEYGLVPTGTKAEGGGTGHFTAMVWLATKDIGCGICRGGEGTVVCQYANSPPNFATSKNSYKDNVPFFDGIKENFEYGGFDVAVVKQMLTQFKSWSLPVGDALTRLYDTSADGSIEPSSQRTASTAITGGIAGGVLALAVAAVVSAFKRGSRLSQRSQMMSMRDLEDADSSLVTE